MTLRDEIDRWTDRTGMTRSDLARIVGCTRANLTAWQAGAWLPRPAMMRALAAVLGVDPTVLGPLMRAARAARKSVPQAVAVAGP